MTDPAPQADGVAALSQALRDTSEKYVDDAYSKIHVKELSRMPTPKVRVLVVCVFKCV